MYKEAAEILGLPEETVKSGLWFLEHRAAAIERKQNGKFLATNEKRLENRLVRIFAKQQKYIIDSLQDLSVFRQKGIRRIERKILSAEIDDIMKGLPEVDTLAETLVEFASGVMIKGARTSIGTYKLGSFGISFTLSNINAIRYMESLSGLHLSDRDGSISKTTKDRIIDTIGRGVSEGLSYNQMAREIEAFGEAGVFSRARATMIATNEIGKAYEFGNFVPVNEYQDRTGKQVKKYWRTQGDDKVTAECAANEDANGGHGLLLEEAFPSGDKTAPRASNPRCRCSTQYDIEI